MSGSEGRLDTAIIGRLKADTDFAQFIHHSLTDNIGNYALLQHNGGSTCLDASSWKDMQFRINNGEKMKLDSTGELCLGNSTLHFCSTKDKWKTIDGDAGYLRFCYNTTYEANLRNVYNGNLNLRDIIKQLQAIMIYINLNSLGIYA